MIYSRVGALFLYSLSAPATIHEVSCPPSIREGGIGRSISDTGDNFPSYIVFHPFTEKNKRIHQVDPDGCAFRPSPFNQAKKSWKKLSDPLSGVGEIRGCNTPTFS